MDRLTGAEMVGALRSAYEQVWEDGDQVIVLMRCGDWLEAIDDSADALERTFGLMITERRVDGVGGIVYSASIPAHESESYVRRLVASGVLVVVIDGKGGNAVTVEGWR